MSAEVVYREIGFGSHAWCVEIGGERIATFPLGASAKRNAERVAAALKAEDALAAAKVSLAEWEEKDRQWEMTSLCRIIEQRDSAQAEARKWKRIAEDAVHVERDELRELRAELARVRGLCPEVIAFAHLMQRKLDMNACKDGAGWDRDGTGRRGWKNCDIAFLREKLTEEVVELIVAIKEPVDRDDVADEAADVGNIAMMLADVCGALSQPAEPEQREGE